MDPPSTGAPASEPAPELVAAIRQLPSFIRAPIYMPTERMPLPDAIAGVARVRALYAHDLDATYRPRLRALKAARRQRRCFVIGNGPSLARTDLAKLRSEVTFATNGFFLKMPELDWTPTYYVVEDHLVGEDRADELHALTGTTKLFPASLAYALRPDDDTVYFDHRPRPSYPDGFDFSFEADVNTYTGGTVTFTCMQLAAYLGFQEIYLIGVDADYSIPSDAAMSGAGRVKELDMRSDDPNHFHPDYFGKGKRWHEPNVDVMLGAYAEARRSTEARGVSIVNATVGGKLEIFPRIDYEMLFRARPAERLLVIDSRRIGDATATGELKAAIFADWPAQLLMQLYRNPDVQDELWIAGGSLEAPIREGLREALDAFDPDMILYRPVPRERAIHDLAMDLISERQRPLAAWIVDDWPTDYIHDHPVRAQRLHTDFRWLLARADVRFSISAQMSAAFHERYGLPFVPIANGIDPGDWPAAKLRSTTHVTVRYAGSLAANMTLASLTLVAQVIEGLADSGVDISFEIRTSPYWRSKHADWAIGLRHTSISTSDLSMADYRRWLAEADILLIAYNFDARSHGYIRYSLANKLPECLASGAATIAVGPADVGTIATLAALDVGELVTEPDEQLIGDGLRRLAASPELRFMLAQRAQAVAFSLFDVRQARRAFEASVGRSSAAHATGDYPRDLHAHVDETAVVADLLEERRGPAHLMLDVGAHGGSSASHFASLGWQVHCFEPDPANRTVLAARFAGQDNVRVDPRAVGEAPQRDVPLYVSPESSGITSLNPFHPSHRPAATVDVTTIEAAADELGLSRVDFLKIDVEGLDFAVLKGVPWSRLRPDVIECEFEDAKTLGLGHSWRDMAAYLGDQGYSVYVSEWHPIVRYGIRHEWRRVVPFGAQLDIDPAAWGNLLAFRDDPGLPSLRRAFARNIEREPARPAHGGNWVEPAPHGASPTKRQPFYTPFARWLKPRAPALHAALRLARRAAAGLWRRRPSARSRRRPPGS